VTRAGESHCGVDSNNISDPRSGACLSHRVAAFLKRSDHQRRQRKVLPPDAAGPSEDGRRSRAAPRQITTGLASRGQPTAPRPSSEDNWVIKWTSGSRKDNACANPRRAQECRGPRRKEAGAHVGLMLQAQIGHQCGRAK
jgi:hypothetical protein